MGEIAPCNKENKMKIVDLEPQSGWCFINSVLPHCLKSLTLAVVSKSIPCIFLWGSTGEFF